MPDGYRSHIELPADLVASAGDVFGDARWLAHVVSSAIRTATLAAERGAHRLVPATPPRSRAANGAAVAAGKVSYRTSRADVERSDAALSAAGSSRRTVALRALESLVTFGSYMDAPMPGETAWRWRTGQPRVATTGRRDAA